MATDEKIEELLAESSATWWEWSIPENRVRFHDRKVTMLGYEPKDFKGRGYEAFTELIHPDDHERALNAMRSYLTGEAPIYRVDYRIRKADGSYTWFIDRGHAIERDEEGKPKVLRGFVFDLGEDLERGALDERLVTLVRQAFHGPEAEGEAKRNVTVCASCKRLKLGPDEWVGVSEGLSAVYPRELSHGICPDCMKKLYPEFVEETE